MTKSTRPEQTERGLEIDAAAQTRDQQQEALEKAGVAKTFSDIMSGARDDRHRALFHAGPVHHVNARFPDYVHLA
jgi:DNA invertase Pin-like site-specific DNA recombinase